MRFAIMIVLVIGNRAAASPWTDWAGEYSGKPRWTQCTAPGGTSATIDAVDGVLAIAVAPVGTLTLVADGESWLAQQADVTVRVTRRGPNTITLAIDFASGCAARGDLVRATTGSASCDRLVAIARIEGRCTKLGHAPHASGPGEPAALRKRAATCEARATSVERELVDVGCAPNPDIALVRSADCLELGQVAARLTRCEAAPADARSQVAALATQLTGGSQTADRASRSVVDAQCRQATARVRELAARLRCPL